MNSLLHRRRLDLAVILVIAAVFILFFSPVLLTGKIFVTNDSFVYSYPLRSIAWDQIRHGSLPLWTPLLMSGYPLLSMAQLGLGYPSTWGYLFLPGHIAEEIYVLAPFLLSPIFMYAWVRVLGRSRLAALFAGLAFGYGGMMFSPIAHNGMLTNTFMWMPLILIAIERARTRSLAHSLFWAAIPTALSVLTGIGQGIVAVATVVLAYALFLSLAANSLKENGPTVGWDSWRRWRPLLVALGAIVLGAGVSAFQILETMQAQRLSIRSSLPYEIFSEGSFTPLSGLKSLLAPLYFQTDVTAYVVPLALLLACWAVIINLRGPRRDLRVFFWFAMAVFGWIWMLGPNTPIYPLLYQIPVLNKFRVPSRHAFEWTFAVSTMAAFGWDAIGARLQLKEAARRQYFKFAMGISSVFIAGVVAWLWWRSTRAFTASVNDDPRVLKYFLSWKLVFTVLLLVASIVGWCLASERLRTTLLVCAMVLACFVEPAMAASYWWWPKAKAPERFSTEARATKVVKERNDQNERVYTYTSVWSEEFRMPTRIDPPNVSAIYGLRDVGGYEPLFPERYSRALGNVTIDGVYPRVGYPFDGTMFDSRSHVLDLLNVRFAISYPEHSTIPDAIPGRDGCHFFLTDSFFSVKPGEVKTIGAASTVADSLALVTALANGVSEPQGGLVARLTFYATNGHTVTKELRAGIDTAEWAIESPNVKPNIKHQKPKVFDSRPADGGIYSAYRFLTFVDIGERLELTKVDIENASPNAELLIWKASLRNRETGKSVPLPHYDENKWRPIHQSENLMVMENSSRLPRVWLVGNGESVTSEEALRRIRGESAVEFDPRQTALLETPDARLPRFLIDEVHERPSANIVKESPGKFTIETSSDIPEILIVSESNYPGWEASVDGKDVPIYTADYLLMGIKMPAGKHQVEMHYAAPLAKRGGIISILAIAVIVGVGLYSRKQRSNQTDSSETDSISASAL